MFDLLKKSSFFIAIICIIVLFLLFSHEKENDHSKLSVVDFVEENKDEAEEKEPPISEEIMIDIKGQVERPGVYEVKSDARVVDAIQVAGGFTAEANQANINLAQKVSDEMIIYVPAVDEEVNVPQEGTNQPGSSSTKVKVNVATQDELETLNGIGPAKAKAIIDYREENGLFQSVDDLLQVPGLGEKTLENIRDHVQIP